jgi:hypothetical protein
VGSGELVARLPVCPVAGSGVNVDSIPVLISIHFETHNVKVTLL